MTAFRFMPLKCSIIRADYVCCTPTLWRFISTTPLYTVLALCRLWLGKRSRLVPVNSCSPKPPFFCGKMVKYYAGGPIWASSFILLSSYEVCPLHRPSGSFRVSCRTPRPWQLIFKPGVVIGTAINSVCNSPPCSSTSLFISSFPFPLSEKVGPLDVISQKCAWVVSLASAVHSNFPFYPWSSSVAYTRAPSPTD